MIYPTRLAIGLTAVGAPLALLLGLLAPGLWLVSGAWIVFVIGLMLLDSVLGAARDRLEIEARPPSTVPVGREGEFTAELTWRGRAPAKVELALETDAKLTPLPERLVVLPAAGRAAARFVLKPVRRGRAKLDRLWVRWGGPFGLVWKQKAIALDMTVAVAPDVQSVKEEAIRLFSREAPFGAKSQIEKGSGSEFDALREFQAGMDPRAIDWKQSARHRTLLAKEFHTERNHPVVFVLDTGRLMSEPVAGMPRIDRAMNAALLSAYVALKTGDRVAFFAFDSKPRLSTAAVTGVQSFGLLQRLAAELDYSTEETNFTLGLTRLSSELERRSLVVVFTDFADSTSAQLMVENLTRLLRTHLVLFVVFRDEELEALARAEPVDSEDVSRAVIAQALLRERDVVIAKLRRLGVQVIDAPLDRVGAELLNGYLDIKRRELV
jgi:uncharacterized protein (DUF58 family)